MSTSGGERRTGFVKWFNKKSGFGFIKLLDPVVVGATTREPEEEEEKEEEEKNDIFVHFSNIRPKAGATVGAEENEEFRFLVKGEYIEFKLAVSNNPKYSHFASDITGIFQGHIMCEMMTVRNSSSSSSAPPPYYYHAEQHPPPSVQTAAAAADEADTLVISKRNRRGGGGRI